MKKIAILTSLIFFPGFTIYAAPIISSIDGVIADGETVRISGSNFGSSNLDIEWLGGANGVIEQGQVGQRFLTAERADWYEDLFPARFDNSNAYSHGKALIFDSRIDTDGRFGLAYDTGGDIQFAYVTYYTYFDNAGYTAGQWKMYRMMPVVSVLDSNTPQIVMFNKRNFGGGSNIQWRPQTSDDQQTWLGTGDMNLPDPGGWYRIEILIKPSSANGVADGWGIVYLHKPGQHINKIYDGSNMLSYGNSDTRRMRYHMFQNYQGNGYGYSGNTGTRVWMDDIYISNTQARVEICNSPTWSACTHRDIQKPTLWSNSSIEITLNQGGIENLDNVYLYVVDSNGAVNENGLRMQTGTANPLTPTNVQVAVPPQ